LNRTSFGTRNDSSPSAAFKTEPFALGSLKFNSGQMSGIQPRLHAHGLIKTNGSKALFGAGNMELVDDSG